MKILSEIHLEWDVEERVEPALKQNWSQPERSIGHTLLAIFLKYLVALFYPSFSPHLSHLSQPERSIGRTLLAIFLTPFFSNISTISNICIKYLWDGKHSRYIFLSKIYIHQNIVAELFAWEDISITFSYGQKGNLNCVFRLLILRDTAYNL